MLTVKNSNLMLVSLAYKTLLGQGHASKTVDSNNFISNVDMRALAELQKQPTVLCIFEPTSQPIWLIYGKSVFIKKLVWGFKSAAKIM